MASVCDPRAYTPYGVITQLWLLGWLFVDSIGIQ